MSEKMNSLFEQATEDAAASSTRSLAGTAQLTSLATEVTNSILKVLNDDLATYADRIEESKKDHSVMDALVVEFGNLDAVDTDFIKELEDHVVDNMIKSQQSKRSRSKSKTMTLVNYRTLMIGAVAENLLRLATGKVKQAGRVRNSGGPVEFSDERLAELKEDQEQLRKEIRNIQSKKSIMKSKEGFSEDDERWQSLLVAEAKLKAIRGNGHTVVVDETKNALSALLEGADISTMKSAEAKALLEKAAALVAARDEENAAE